MFPVWVFLEGISLLVEAAAVLDEWPLRFLMFIDVCSVVSLFVWSVVLLLVWSVVSFLVWSTILFFVCSEVLLWISSAGLPFVCSWNIEAIHFGKLISPIPITSSWETTWTWWHLVLMDFDGREINPDGGYICVSELYNSVQTVPELSLFSRLVM